MPLPRTTEQVHELLATAAQDLFDSGVLGEFTPDTHESEWNLSQHLATAIEGYLPELQRDVDPIKPRAGRRRPDIVFHRRGIHRLNYLVIEVKKNGSRRAVLLDAWKIRRYWFRAPYRYRFGATVNLLSSHAAEIQVYQNDL
jgi:hypothetical protein